MFHKRHSTGDIRGKLGLIRITYGALLLPALLLLILPVRWLICVLLGVMIHEFAHIFTLIVFGGKIYGIDIGVGSVVIDSYIPDKKAEMLSILAGPVSSLFLVMLWQYIPEIAVCGMVHGIFNLAPVYPLDGGRLLRLVIKEMRPEKAETIEKGFLFGSVVTALVTAVWLKLCL